MIEHITSVVSITFLTWRLFIVLNIYPVIVSSTMQNCGCMSRVLWSTMLVCRYIALVRVRQILLYNRMHNHISSYGVPRWGNRIIICPGNSNITHILHTPSTHRDSTLVCIFSVSPLWRWSLTIWIQPSATCARSCNLDAEWTPGEWAHSLPLLHCQLLSGFSFFRGGSRLNYAACPEVSKHSSFQSLGHDTWSLAEIPKKVNGQTTLSRLHELRQFFGYPSFGLPRG